PPVPAGQAAALGDHRQLVNRLACRLELGALPVLELDVARVLGELVGQRPRELARVAARARARPRGRPRVSRARAPAGAPPTAGTSGAAFSSSGESPAGRAMLIT